ncbi:MAG TPA: hypothetical protein ENJ09_09230, partial [Planctomycetes bacterium]|nr:hypothetical protein [Planctomycetota bacterium]
MSMRSLLLCLPLLTPLSAAPRAQEQLESRELSAIVEEQDQLLRQLHRLRGTMEVLLERLEAEKRPQTAELLRQAIETLDTRIGPDGQAPRTLEERMEAARQALESGQLVRSLEEQQELIGGLEQLLSILLDRKDIDALDEKLEELADLGRAVEALSQRESDLEEETRRLREDSSNDAQRRLEATLSELEREQRALLSATERAGRESGLMELEALRRELDEILTDQHTDTAVLGAWNPEEEAPLEEARAALREAQRGEAGAARLARALEEIERARESAARAEPGADLADPAERLRDAAREAREAARTSQDDAVQAAADALERANQAFSSLASGESEGAEAATELERLAAELERAERTARAAAERSRGEAEARLGELQDDETTAGRAASEVRDSLARARRASEREDAGETRAATDEAAALLERHLSELRRLAQALSESQAEQARRTERLDRGLSNAPRAAGEAGDRARDRLEAGAQAMKEASDAA